MNDRYGIIDMLMRDERFIKKSRKQVNWNQLFQNKNVNEEEVAILDNIILNIFSNFVLNKTLTILMRETPHGWLSIQNQKYIGKTAFTTDTWTGQGIMQITKFYNKQYQRCQS